MNKRIKIENVLIRLPRSVRGSALAAGRSIGNDIARSVANVVGTREIDTRIDELSIGRVPTLSSVAEHAQAKLTAVLAERGKK